MKKATLNKLFASALAVALCVPVLLANPITANASAVTLSGDVPSDSSSSSEDSGTSSSSEASGTSSSSSSEASAASVASFANGAVSLALHNTVVVGGKNMQSTVGGVFIATAVNGAAVTTPVASLNAAIGLSQADVDAGTNARFYICNSTNKETKAALQSVAEATGKTVGAYINVDLYTITKQGKVTAVRNSVEPVTMTFGLPGRIVNAGSSASVICIGTDGKSVVMEDTDTDPKTLTIDTKVFGVYAIVY